MKMTREQLMQEVDKNKIIVILRGLNRDQLLKAVTAMEAGGIRMVEVTFDQSKRISDGETAANIRAIAETFAGRMHVGAGTVMSVEQVELAHAAGAEYIISPDCYQPVIERTRELGMLSMPGVFTPTEAAMAHRWGADYVKLFPNSEVKLSYLKVLMAPLSHIRFLAVGGVNETNIADYLEAGAKGVGIATGIVNKQMIAEGNYAGITELARTYTRAAGVLQE